MRTAILFVALASSPALAQLETSMSANETSGTATLAYTLDAAPLTTYTYTAASQTVHITPRAQIALSLADLRKGVMDLAQWQEFLSIRWGQPSDGVPYKVVEEYRPAKTSYHLKILAAVDAVVADGEYVKATGIVTIQARPELTLTWQEFALFVQGYRRLLALAEKRAAS